MAAEWQRRRRKRKRDDEVEDGTRDPIDGQSINIESTLKDVGGEGVSRAELAKTSRPFRADKIEKEEAKQVGITGTTLGRPITKDRARPAKYVNWKSPTIFEIINRTAQKATHVGQANRRTIVEALRKENPIFEQLDDRTLGRWIDYESSINRVVWKDSVMKEVDQGIV